MHGPSGRGRRIRAFIIENIPDHPRDVVRVASKKFGISRQAINRYIKDLVMEGLIDAAGGTSGRWHSLVPLREKTVTLPLSGLEEDHAWRAEVSPTLSGLPRNVLDIWHYAFTEMVNNAVDHSAGGELVVTVKMNALLTEIYVHDDGVGIFRKIKEECHLEDERHAILELSKGKLTTDPDHHTGEGIFFTSRMLDDFVILSGDVFFSHRFGEREDWILEREAPRSGTTVLMFLNNNSDRTDQEVFDRFASEDEDYGFTKTVVPVHLARHGLEKLISRSQAKRLLARVDRFNTVVFDFQDVDSIGQAFADEIFRVFEREHPGVLVMATNTGPQVQKMIDRAHGKRGT
ncbi:MAG: DUF4325 domain-containing protein [Candidatus Krumholzibacteria bacterium]